MVRDINRHEDRRETEMLGGWFIVAGIGVAIWAVAWAWWVS